MEIEFISKHNHLIVPDPFLGVKEFDDAEYMGTVRSDGDHYKLVLTRKGDDVDENREMLAEEFTLVFDGTIGNLVQFDIMEGDEKAGRFYFSYYPDTDYKTFQVCLEIRKWKGVPADVFFSFGRLKHFAFRHG